MEHWIPEKGEFESEGSFFNTCGYCKGAKSLLGEFLCWSSVEYVLGVKPHRFTDLKGGELR